MNMNAREQGVHDLHEGQHRQSLGQQLGLRRGDALIVVDMQKDFLPGGALGVPGGDEVVAPLNDYIAAFAERELPIFFTRDWHPPQHCSFRESGGPWPPHCVRETPGADWADGLHVPPQAHVISKATEPDAEAYSGFAGTSLLEQLQALRTDRVFVGGLATDYCVHATVLAARQHGFDVVVLRDAIRAVNVQAEDESRAIREMLEAGATLFDGAHALSSHPA